MRSKDQVKMRGNWRSLYGETLQKCYVRKVSKHGVEKYLTMDGPGSLPAGCKRLLMWLRGEGIWHRPMNIRGFDRFGSFSRNLR